MTRKSLAKLILAALALAGSPMVLACQTTNWTGGAQGAPIAGEPDDATPVARYSGKCGLRGNAGGNYVRDNSPSAEAKYRARFYVFTGVTGGTGEAVVFRATRASDSASMIRVSYDTTANAFKFYVGANDTSDGTATGAVDNAWYAVELNYSASSPSELRYTVQGASSTTPLASANNTLATAAPTAADVIDTAELGWVANIGGTPTGVINVDAFDSRRTSAIGRLCRGDATNNNTITAGDRSAITSELALPPTLALGQPDCTENGTVTAGDRSCITALLAVFATCADNH